MAIDFPASPSNGQTHVVGSVTYTYDGTKWTAVAAGGGGGGATDKIEEGNTSAEVIDTGSDGAFVVTTEGSERARVDPSGRLLVGTSSARTNFFASSAQQPQIQVEATSAQTARISVVNNSNDINGTSVTLCKSRGTSVGSSTVVQSGDTIGVVNFLGADGTNLLNAAAISAEVDGTPGANDMPGRLVFSTTPDGSAAPVPRMQIINIGGNEYYCDNGGWSQTLYNGSAASVSDYLIAGYHSATGLRSGTKSFEVATNGNVKNTNNSYAALSDVKLKENIVDASSQWGDLKALRVVNYNFKPETGAETFKQLGLIAQEVETVCPGLVGETPDRDLDGNDLGTVTKSVNYSVLYMKAVKALQEAMERIEVLEAKVNALEGNTP